VIYRRLGRTGPLVSALALGSGQFGAAVPEREAHRVLATAMDAGVTLIDTADSYQDGLSQEIVGAYLRSSGRRDQTVVIAKVGSSKSVPPGQRHGGATYLRTACEATLRRLGTDRVDILMLHRPDPTTDPAETVDGLSALRDVGMIGWAATSGYAAWILTDMLHTPGASDIFVCEQPPYNVLDRRVENELLPMASRFGLGVTPWSPGAGGILSGQYVDGVPSHSRLGTKGPRSRFGQRVTPGAVEASGRLAELATHFGLSGFQLALLWCLHRPSVTAPVVGARTVAQITGALDVAERRLPVEAAEEIDRIVPPGRALADFHSSAKWFLGSSFG
jgi:1-deoxyxylulose-5-phosphate synthase